MNAQQQCQAGEKTWFIRSMTDMSCHNSMIYSCILLELVSSLLLSYIYIYPLLLRWTDEERRAYLASIDDSKHPFFAESIEDMDPNMVEAFRLKVEVE